MGLEDQLDRHSWIIPHPIERSSLGNPDADTWSPSDSSVSLAAMGDPQREHDQLGVLDRVDDSVVADADPPQLVVAEQASAPRWPRIGAKGGDCPCDPSGHLSVELAEFLPCRGLVADAVLNAVTHRPRSCATSSAGMTCPRPASMSASRREAIAPSSWSISDSYASTKSAGTIAAAREWPRPRVTSVISPPNAARFTASENRSRAWLTDSSVCSTVMEPVCAKYANIAIAVSIADRNGVHWPWCAIAGQR